MNVSAAIGGGSPAESPSRAGLGAKRRVLPVLLCGLVLFVAMSVMASAAAAVAVPLAFFVLALPGVALVRALLAADGGGDRTLATWLLGSVTGIALGATVAALLIGLAGASPPAAVAVLLSGGLLAAWELFRHRRTVPAPARSSDLNVVLAFAVLVTVLSLPAHRAFARPGEQQTEFVGLHRSDMLHHLATTVELSASIPPQNPYFSG